MVLSFHYRHGNGLLHRCNPSLKFILYLAVNLLFSFSPNSMLIGLFILLFLFALVINSKILLVAKELRAFFWVFFISYVSRAHLSGGEQIALFPWISQSQLKISWNPAGAVETGFFILQVSAAIITTDLLMFSTPIGALQSGIYSCFAPLHPKFAWKLSTMLRLMLSSIPILMEAATFAKQRLKLRGLIPRKMPLPYLRGMVTAILHTVNSLSGAYVQALLARGWNSSGSPTGRNACLSSADALLLGLVLFMLITGILFAQLF